MILSDWVPGSCVVHKHTCRQNIHIHKIKIKIFKNNNNLLVYFILSDILPQLCEEYHDKHFFKLFSVHNFIYKIKIIRRVNLYLLLGRRKKETKTKLILKQALTKSSTFPTKVSGSAGWPWTPDPSFYLYFWSPVIVGVNYQAWFMHWWKMKTGCPAY